MYWVRKIEIVFDDGEAKRIRIYSQVGFNTVPQADSPLGQFNCRIVTDMSVVNTTVNIEPTTPVFRSKYACGGVVDYLRYWLHNRGMRPFNPPAFFLALLAFAPRAVFCADKLDAPRWQIVTMGDVVAAPIPLSFGSALLTDGRSLAACTSSGSVVWSYTFAELPLFASSDTQDFVYAVSGNSRLQKINPSGRLLWKINVQEKILYPPLPGRDGRVFVVTEKSVCCYDTRGRRKWRTELPRRAVSSPLELGDGSILVVTPSAGDATVGVRVSPFGRMMEEITFAGIVQSAAQTDAGALLAFSSGMYGLCAVSEGKASSVWTASGLSQPLTLVSVNDVSAVVYADGAAARVRFIDTATGKILASVRNVPVNPRALNYAAVAGSLLVLSDSSAALALDIAVALASGGADSDAGECVLWHIALPDSFRAKYVWYAGDGMLFLTGANWTTVAYRVYQAAGGNARARDAGSSMTKSYAELQRAPSSGGAAALLGINRQELNAVSSGLRRGDYGEQELVWFAGVNSVVPFLTARYTQTGGYRADTAAPSPVTDADLSALVLTMGDFGCGAFTQTIAQGIRLETDPSLLRNMIRAAAEISYDPDGVLLDALAFVPKKRGDSSIEASHIAVCDAVRAICAYMGLPALTQRGRAILNAYLSTGYDERVRDYAIQSLKKLL
jgi:hypothetical protein